MRNIGLTRVEAEKQRTFLWNEIRHYGGMMSGRETALREGGKSKAHDREWMRLERMRLDAIGDVHEIEESGVIPWIENDRLGSSDPESEVWALRVMKRSYHTDSQGEYDRVLVVTSQSRQHSQSIQMSREAAEELRDQLIYELDEWEEK